MLSDERKPKRIRDPVHGLIVFCEGKSEFQDETDRIAWNLLNTVEFQRLRRINQLGFSSLTYPGATHSRFSHSVGTYHLARQLIDLIDRRISQKRIRTDILETIAVKDGGHREHRQRVALLAALVHDIGHGPFSHVFESVVKDAHRQRKKQGQASAPPRLHEQRSAEIVASAGTDVNRVLTESPPGGANQRRLAEEIARLLKSDEPEDIYATVVSSQFDADRLDYMQRDRLMTGVQSSHIDLDWIIDCLEVGALTMDDGLLLPCFFLNKKGIQSAVEYLRARNELYRMVYFHKTTRAAEVMLRELLNRAANTFDRISKRNPSTLDCADRRLLYDPVLRYLSSESPPVSSYIELDDDVMSSTIAALAGSSDRSVSCLAKRLRTRKLLKCEDLGTNTTRSVKRQIEGLTCADEILFDDASSNLYEGWDDTKPLKLILVRGESQGPNDDPVDIVMERRELQSEEDVRVERAYGPEQELQEMRDFFEKPTMRSSFNES